MCINMGICGFLGCFLGNNAGMNIDGMKIERVFKTDLSPEKEETLPKQDGALEIDLLGSCTLKEDIKNIFKELCRESDVNESEIMFYDESSFYKDWEPTFTFGIYFRGHQFFFDCEDWSCPTKKEEYRKTFERYLKMTSEEIDIHEEDKKRREEEMANKKNLVGPNYMKGFQKGNRSDEDDCTGEYYWNID